MDKLHSLVGPALAPPTTPATDGVDCCSLHMFGNAYVAATAVGEQPPGLSASLCEHPHPTRTNPGTDKYRGRGLVRGQDALPAGRQRPGRR